jgi:cytochrome c biogenesis protein CcdA
MLTSTCAFLLGFGLVFVLSGATAFPVAHAVRTGSSTLQGTGGAVFILFGIYLIWRAIRSHPVAAPLAEVPPVRAESAPRVANGGWANRAFSRARPLPPSEPSGKGLRGREWLRNAPLLFGACGFVIGAGFGAAWTPCIGPVLASILLQASFPETGIAGATLLGVFASGLLLPFLLVGISMAALLQRLPIRTIPPAAGSGIGGTAILLGIMLLTDRIASLTAWLTRFETVFDLRL